jgi:toxin ParE1/3/4
VILPVALNDKAAAEFDEAVEWLEANYGSAHRFIDRLQKVLDGIGQRPEMHRVILDDIRRAVVPKTQYSIYYRLHSDWVEVVSIFHGSRNPSKWGRRG